LLCPGDPHRIAGCRKAAEAEVVSTAVDALDQANGKTSAAPPRHG